jgi:hypothetical protein
MAGERWPTVCAFSSINREKTMKKIQLQSSPKKKNKLFAMLKTLNAAVLYDRPSPGAHVTVMNRA